MLKTCRSRTCTHPWEVSHSQGDVKSFADAPHPRFDKFYLREQECVGFMRCKKGYILESEGPIEANVFGGTPPVELHDSSLWSHLVCFSYDREIYVSAISGNDHELLPPPLHVRHPLFRLSRQYLTVFPLPSLLSV
jgi:hypothetical protein